MAGSFQVKIHFSIERCFDTRWHPYSVQGLNLFLSFVPFFVCLFLLFIPFFVCLFLLFQMCIFYFFFPMNFFSFNVYLFRSFSCSSLAWHRITSSQSVSRCSQQSEDVFLCIRTRRMSKKIWSNTRWMRKKSMSSSNVECNFILFSINVLKETVSNNYQHSIQLN